MNTINVVKQFLSCESHNCFENNRFHNAFTNGKVYHVSYKGLSIEQRPEVIDVFEKLFVSIKPSRVIEIGTFAGGLTLIIRDILDNTNQQNSIVHTYDVSEAMWLKEQVLKNTINNLCINTYNLFDSDYKNISDNKVAEHIKNLIRSDGTTVLLCDGGCKKCEFNLLSEYLKPGDIIMAHDYAPTIEYFEQNMKHKIWNWCEIKDSDIENSCKEYNLQPFMRNEFLKVAWACFKKSSTE